MNFLYTQTPLLQSRPYASKTGRTIHLKLENTQPSGSFKSRGLGNLVYQHHNEQQQQQLDQPTQVTGTTPAPPRQLHFLSSSGGNAGLATAVAAATLGHRCTVVVPKTTKPRMRELIAEAGAEVIVHGDFWGDADRYLRETYLSGEGATITNTADAPVELGDDSNEKMIYCHPYDDQLLWNGYTSIVDELGQQLADHAYTQALKSSLPGAEVEKPSAPVWPDAIICAVGGGGLYTGLVQGLLAAAHDDDNLTRPLPIMITAETNGASKLYQSLHAGHKVTLAAPSTVASSLAAFSVSDQAYAYASAVPIPGTGAVHTVPVTVTDAEAVSACTVLLDTHGLVVEPACGAALAVLDHLDEIEAKLANGKKLQNVVVIVCGGSAYMARDLLLHS
jgi:L-serine/L-threonine ammonia-lyase